MPLTRSYAKALFMNGVEVLEQNFLGIKEKLNS